VLRFSPRERQRSGAHARYTHKPALEVSVKAGTLEHGLAPKRGGLSLEQCPSMERKASTAGAAQRARGKRPYCASYPEREAMQALQGKHSKQQCKRYRANTVTYSKQQSKRYKANGPATAATATCASAPPQAPMLGGEVRAQEGEGKELCRLGSFFFNIPWQRNFPPSPSVSFTHEAWPVRRRCQANVLVVVPP